VSSATVLLDDGKLQSKHPVGGGWIETE